MNPAVETRTSSTQGANLPTRAGKYLTFRLGAEEYGIPILKVREIIGLMAITRMPEAPSYVRNAFDLRVR